MENQKPKLKSFSLKSINPDFSAPLATLEQLQETISFLDQDTQLILLVGFSSDIGAHNCDNRTGQELGPNSFREIRLKNQLPLNNFYYGIDMERVNMQVIDCGNIQPKLGDLEQTLEQLEKYVGIIVKWWPNSIVIVIGGTDDLNYTTTKAFAQNSTENFDILRIDPQIDMEQKYRKQLDEQDPIFYEHHQSHFRMTIENSEIMKKIERIILFGLQGHQVSQDQIDFLNQNYKDKFQLLFYDRDIRRYRSQEPKSSLYKPAQVLNNLSLQNSSKILLNLDLQSMKSQYAIGVSEPCPAFGFNIQEIEELIYNIGQYKGLKLITISEYNPAIEKIRTGNLVNSIYHHLLLGIAQRLIEEGKIKEVKQNKELKEQQHHQQIDNQQQYIYSSILD